MKKNLIVVLLLFCIIVLKSQDTTKVDIFDYSLEDLMNLKITSVSKIEESVLKTPQTIIILTAEDLRNRGYTDLEQVFHDLPGFDISRGYGTLYSQIYQRGYRSNNTERTLLLIDGVEENDIWKNVVWLSRQYPLSNIKRIEIIYGPASSVYGANAFLGVINIVTKNASDVSKKNIGINAQTFYGSWNTQATDITLSGQKDNMNFILTGRYFYSDSYDLSSFDDWDYDLTTYNLDYYKQILNTDNDSIAQTALNLDNIAYYKDSALNNINPHFSNTAKDWLIYGKAKLEKFTLGFQIYKRNEGYGAWYRDDFELGPENGGRWVPNNLFYYVKYSTKITKNLTFTNFTQFKIHKLAGISKELYYVGYMNGELGLDNLTDSTGNLLPADQITTPYWDATYWSTYSQQFRSEYRFNYNLANKFNWNNIFEFRRGHIQGAYFYSCDKYPDETAPPREVLGGNFFEATDYGYFSQINYTLVDNLKLVAGASLNYNRIRTHGGYGFVANPKAAIVFSPKKFVFKLIYSEAFQDASYWTKYGTTLGRLLNNPNLQPEKVKNYEFSTSWLLSNNILLFATAYHSNYQGAVGTVNVTFINDEGDTIQTTQHQAVGEYMISGVETYLTGKFNKFSFYVNYTFTSPFSVEENGNLIRIGDIAAHKANAGLNYMPIKNLNLNLRANYVGKRLTGKNTTISSNPNDFVEPYYILNGAVSYRFFRHFTLQFNALNILNLQYYDPGVRSADGVYYASLTPQYPFNYSIKLYIDF